MHIGNKYMYKIPAHTVCPYKDQAPGCDTCWHKGVDHEVDFSCALARGLRMIEMNKAKGLNNEIKENG